MRSIILEMSNADAGALLRFVRESYRSGTVPLRPTGDIPFGACAGSAGGGSRN